MTMAWIEGRTYFV